jgi:hypothetical protein
MILIVEKSCWFVFGYLQPLTRRRVFTRFLAMTGKTIFVGSC